MVLVPTWSEIACASASQYDQAMPDDAVLTPPILSACPTAEGWRARLRLEFTRRAERTVLTGRVHQGPLRVQKALYPEGQAICHGLLLHPPSGIVGGDQLDIDVEVREGAHALLTNPGATKWYRSAGATALQDIRLRVEAAARLEWLPQENIVFDGALGQQTLQVDLASAARFLAFEVLCLGRRAAGERFTHGRFGMQTCIRQAGMPLWHEWGTLHGGSAFLDSPVGLRGAHTSATLLLAGVEDAPALAKVLRAALPASPQWAVTGLPGVLVARWLGLGYGTGSAVGPEAARGWFLQCWHVLRPLTLGAPAVTPRIWRT